MQKDEKTGKTLILYDATTTDNRPYVVCNLFVGQVKNKYEEPVPFVPDNLGPRQAYLYINKGHPRDIEDNIIQDKTVVEFSYNVNDRDIAEHFRWIPLRTRYDKTEIANKYKKKFGNETNIASRIWRSIHQNYTMTDINILSDNDQYSDYMHQLKSRLEFGFKAKIDNRPSNNDNKTAPNRVYYQKISELAQPMRSFHNWIKSNMISLYCSPFEKDNKKKRILDFGCGRGGDLHKIFNSNIDLYVGIDIDYAGLFSTIDCAQTRYDNLRKSMKNVPKTYFIQADGSALLNSNNQIKAFNGTMSETNKELISKFFDKKQKFDIINMQFSIHYFLANSNAWSNLCENINSHLEDGGHILITCFDADAIKKLLKDKKSYEIFYKNETGENKLLIDIKKKYIDNNKDDLGQAIDIFNSTFSEDNTYITEYLVSYNFLVNNFRELCDLQLVESDTFENIYHLNKHMFQHMDSTQTNDKLLSKVRKYYELLSNNNIQYDNLFEKNVADASFNFTKLNRYYIFRKKVSSEQSNNKLSREIYDSVENGSKGDKYYSLAHLRKYLKNTNLYAVNKSYNSIDKLNKAIFKYNKINNANVYVIDNESDKLLINNNKKYELLENDSINIYKLKSNNQFDHNIIVYKNKGQYYHVVYLNNDKNINKHVFSNNNKYIQYIDEISVTRKNI
jgi:SAM-dependent methyltransferase